MRQSLGKEACSDKPGKPKRAEAWSNKDEPSNKDRLEAQNPLRPLLVEITSTILRARSRSTMFQRLWLK